MWLINIYENFVLTLWSIQTEYYSTWKSLDQSVSHKQAVVI